MSDQKRDCEICDGLFLPCSCPTSLADNIGTLIEHDIEGCCIWTGALSGGGKEYGYVRFGGKAARAHRVVWRHARGPLEEGHVLHHKCGNTHCVKPDHLLDCESNAENMAFEVKDICQSGRHPLDEETRMSDGRCRACHREKARRSNWKKGWVEPCSEDAEWLGCRCRSKSETEKNCPVHRDYHACKTCYMNPGSDSARQQGCICGVLDNGHGHNRYRMVVNADCPVHG